MRSQRSIFYYYWFTFSWEASRFLFARLTTNFNLALLILPGIIVCFAYALQAFHWFALSQPCWQWLPGRRRRRRTPFRGESNAQVWFHLRGFYLGAQRIPITSCLRLIVVCKRKVVDQPYRLSKSATFQVCVHFRKRERGKYVFVVSRANIICCDYLLWSIFEQEYKRSTNQF